jgi:nucleoside-diphosphate-sugar epimerase
MTSLPLVSESCSDIVVWQRSCFSSRTVVLANATHPVRFATSVGSPGSAMRKQIFLTGASGFVGGAICRALAPRHELAALSRSSAGDAQIAALGVAPVRGDLSSLRAEDLGGAEIVVHCAAFVKQWGTREEFWNTNVEGTRRMLDVARRVGVRRFIHIGTEAALFHGQHLRDIDEAYPYALHSPFLYSQTKAAAEQLVLAANAADFATLSIRPRFVWGPGDQTILPVIEAMVRSGRFMWIDQGRARSSTTHISNLVHAVGLSLEHGAGGEAYFVTDGGTTTMREFLTALLATRKLTPPDKSLPGWLVRSLAGVTETAWKALALKTEPPLTRFAAAMMSRDCTIRTDKARRDLGYEPVISREEGLKALSGA